MLKVFNFGNITIILFFAFLLFVNSSRVVVVQILWEVIINDYSFIFAILKTLYLYYLLIIFIIFILEVIPFGSRVDAPPILSSFPRKGNIFRVLEIFLRFFIFKILLKQLN